METQVAFFLALIAGFIFGGAVVWLILRSDMARAYDKAKSELTGDLSKLEERLSGKDSRIEDLMRDRDQLKAELEKRHQETAELSAAKADLTARLAEAGKLADEKLAAVTETQELLANRFKALSAQALESNNQTFLDLAQQALQRFQEGAKNDLEVRQQAIGTLVEPLRDSLGKVDTSVRNILQSHAGVQEQVKMLVDAQNLLRTETSKLANALRNPGAGGRWGEMQLRRVVELAGMDAHCDFDEQSSFENEAGRQRPDLVVHLPGKRQLAVDAKVSLNAYLEALEAEDEQTRAAKFSEHAALVKAHLRRLGTKQYWAQLDDTPEFVVAFLPGEAFFAAALEGDAQLIEYGVEQRVILATPTTLIALLKAVAYGWRQEQLAENAKEISDLGRQLYQRLYTFTQHLDGVRNNLQRTVEGYNRAVGSLESRVLVSARRFQQLGAGGEQELGVLDPIDTFPRSLQAVEAAVASVGPSVELDDLQPDLPGIQPEIPYTTELADTAPEPDVEVEVEPETETDEQVQPEPDTDEQTEPEPEPALEAEAETAQEPDSDSTPVENQETAGQPLESAEPPADEPPTDEPPTDEPPIIEWTARASEPESSELEGTQPSAGQTTDQADTAPVEEPEDIEVPFEELSVEPDPVEPDVETAPTPEPFDVSVASVDEDQAATEAGTSPPAAEEVASAAAEPDPPRTGTEPATEVEEAPALAADAAGPEVEAAENTNPPSNEEDDDDDDPKPLRSGGGDGPSVEAPATMNYVAFVKAM